jgi:hypothetical protein
VVDKAVANMVEIDVGKVKVQKRQRGSFLVTIPSAAVKILKIEGQEELTASVDVEKSSVSFRKED